jgi:hypothetical protein
MNKLWSLAFALLFAGTSALAQNASMLSDKLTAAYGAADAAKVSVSVDKLFKRPAPPNNAIQLATDCIAATELARYLGKSAADRAGADADALLAIEDPAHLGKAGWSLPVEENGKDCAGPGSAISFGSTCNPPGTIYMFETGLALTCLGKAYGLTQKPEYLSGARAAVDATWNAGAENCPDCFFYWYSLNPANAGRYVRNTNVLMGMGLAAFYADTREARLVERMRAIAAAEHAELAAGNLGYYGINDMLQRTNAARERRRIENHVPSVAVGLYEIGAATNDDTAKYEGMKLMQAWMHCGASVCGLLPCKNWGADSSRCMVTQTAAPCFFANRDPDFKNACRAYLDRADRLGSYQLWALLHGLG